MRMENLSSYQSVTENKAGYVRPQLIALNAIMAVGMCLCTFTGSLKVSFAVAGYQVAFPASNILFALLTFPVTDIIADVCGRHEAQRCVWVGFVAQALTLLCIELMVLLPGDTTTLAPFRVGGLRVFLGSSIAYILAQSWDVWVFHWIKERWTGQARLWLRNNLSTMSSQLLNSCIFITIVFGPSELPLLLPGSVLVKLCAALADTPLVYAGCRWLRSSGHIQL